MVLFGTKCKRSIVTRIKPASRRVPDSSSAALMRDRVLGAAFSAFMERGYEGASTLDIATRAKVSK
jgi:AcrR family transcriptional regulator